MRLFGLFRKKPIKQEYKPITLNAEEQKIFERLKDAPVKVERRPTPKREDRQLKAEECFFLPGGKAICSLSELLNHIKTLNDGDFSWLVLSRKQDIQNWIISMLGKPVLAEQLIQCHSKQKFIKTLDQWLSGRVNLEEQLSRDEDFYQMLDILKYKFEDVKEDVRQARKQGINTFIPQTKLMNIKPKIDFAEVKQDKAELGRISSKLDEIEDDLEFEKKEGKNVRAET